MKKLMLILVLLSFLSFGCTTTKNSNSQDPFTKELKWNTSDLIPHPVFQDTNQIIQWGNNFSHGAVAQFYNLKIRNYNVFILMVDQCSGLYCPSIYIFKENNEHWQLMVSSVATLRDFIGITVDNNQEKIIFQSQGSQIGELPFEILDIKLDKTTE